MRRASGEMKKKKKLNQQKTHSLLCLGRAVNFNRMRASLSRFTRMGIECNKNKSNITKTSAMRSERHREWENEQKKKTTSVNEQIKFL